MTELQQNSRWQEAGFPDIDFHPVMRAASALYNAMGERNFFSPSTMPPAPDQFARRVVGSSHWNHAFDVALSNVLPKYYNALKWSGQISDIDDMLWTWADMQEEIANDTEWTLSDYTSRDLDMVLPTVNWANARREALQRLKWLNISRQHASHARLDTYSITLEHGTVVPSYQEQLSMLQATQPVYSTILDIYIMPLPIVSIEFLTPGNRVGIGTNYDTITADVMQLPKITFNQAFQSDVMLKYTYERTWEYRSGSSYAWDKDAWIGDMFFANKDMHELVTATDASGNLPENVFQNMYIANPELMPNYGDIRMRQWFEHNIEDYNMPFLFADMSGDFQYE